MKRLQPFEFNQSPYERPNQDWVCGRLGEGRSCRIGPDRRGRCRAVAECQPRREGDGWVCTRPPTAGGRCDSGPRPDGSCAHPIPPCVPTRSLRKRRGMAVAWMAVLTIGLIVVALSTPAMTRILSPGPLTLQHGDIGDCGGCHTDFAGGPSRWLHAAFEADDPQKDSRLCLNCHVAGDEPMNPHGVTAARLEAMTQASLEAQPQSRAPPALRSAAFLFDQPMKAAGEGLACATCHSEHHGADFDLTQMSNERCQSCHTVQFTSFSHGHPDFGAWPYERRTRINFDHVSHFGRHFEKAGLDKAPDTCGGCHMPAGDGGTMLVKSFAGMCSDCHLEQIAGSEHVGVKGIPFFAVPGLDLIELREWRADIGEWPDWSEQPIPPIMRSLLAADPGLSEAMAHLDSLDALDLTDMGEEDLEAVETVAWGTKSLLRDLIVEGEPAIARRLAESFDLPLDQTAIARMAGVLPLDVLRAAQEEWFPNLWQELALHERGEAVVLPGSVPEEGEEEAAEEPAPDAVTEESDGGTADILGEDQGILGDEEGAILGEDQGILGGEEGAILGEDQGILGDEEGAILGEDQGILGGEEGAILGEDQGILGGEEGAILGEDQGILGDEEGGILGAEDGGILGGEGILSGEPVETEPLEEVAAEEPEEPAGPPEIDSEAWADWGGWYRRNFALYYRPLDHADRFMRTWLEVSGLAFGTEAEPLAEPVFTALAADNSPGKCTKCHSVDREAEGILNVKWRPFEPEPMERDATRFSHATHFSLLDQKGCRTCHQMDDQADYLAGFKDFDPQTYHSNFQAMDIAVCRDCHMEEVAGESCVLCHRYHVGELVTQPVRTEVMEREQK